MRRSLFITVLLFSIIPLVFISCDTTNEPPTLPVAFKTAPSDGLNSMIQETPSDFTWDYFQNNVQVSLIPGPEWSGSIVLSAFQVQNSEVVNHLTTKSVETTAEELSTGLSTEEMFPETSWVSGKTWVQGIRGSLVSKWTPGNGGTPSEIEDMAITESELGENQTMVVVYASIAGDSPEREQTTQPFGIIFQEQQQQEVELTSQEVSANEATEARNYWTAQRMLEAAPVEGAGIGQDSEDPPAPTNPDIPGPGVEMQQRAGNPPESVEKGTTGDVIESDTQVDEASQVSSDYTQYPYRTVGKVFFTKDGNGFSCSAAVIASENRSVVWTAGHCVAEQGKEDWHDRWVFVPAYKDGEAPLGKWSARTKTTLVAWYSDGNRNYDLGAVVVEEHDNQSIASVTGSLGWMFNAQRSQDWTELGYPGAGSFI